MTHVLVLRKKRTYIVIGPPLDDLDRIRAEVPELQQQSGWRVSSLDTLSKAYTSKVSRVGSVYVGAQLAKELSRTVGWIDYEYQDDKEYLRVTNGEVGRVLMFYLCHLRTYKHRYLPITRNKTGQCQTCFNYAYTIDLSPQKKETNS